MIFDLGKNLETDTVHVLQTGRYATACGLWFGSVGVNLGMWEVIANAGEQPEGAITCKRCLACIPKMRREHDLGT